MFDKRNEELFDRFEALTFDDVVVVPGYSETLPDQVDTSAVFARDIVLQIPIVSAAMDRVTEARMAIAIARAGGIGVIHRNLPIDEQVAEVERVKRSQSGMITDPLTLSPDATLADAEAVMARFHVSGLPVVEDGDRLVGILTNRDVRFCEPSDRVRPVREFMTSEGLVTAPEGTTLDAARKLLQQYRIEKLPLVDRAGRLRGLITVKDILKSQSHPHATLDSSGRLRVAAAVGVGDDLEARVSALVARGVDAVSIDTAHGHSLGVVTAIRRIRTGWPDLAIVAGNIVTAEAVDALADAGADAVKVGVGAGSICTTRVVAGAGLPQLSAIWEAGRAGRRRGIPVIGDGGITYSGDIVKAIAAGASTVMLGSLLAGTDESPGDMELFEGRRYKSYRGMGSLGAMAGLGADRYASAQKAGSSGADSDVGDGSRGDSDVGDGSGGAGGSGGGGSPRRSKVVPEGIEGRVGATGPVAEMLYQLVGGLRSGMGYAGAARLEELRTTARFARITTAGRIESHPHDVQITNEAPNYRA